MGDIISKLEDVQNCVGITSVLWRIFSTVEDIQYCQQVSTVGDTINNVEDINYCEGHTNPISFSIQLSCTDERLL